MQFIEGSLNHNSGVRHAGLNWFMKQKGNLRHAEFTAEEEWRIAHPCPKTQVDRILTICAQGVGLREAIAAATR